MTDLGGDVSKDVMSTSAKLIEALLKLLEKIYQLWREAPERGIKKLEYMELKDNREKKEALKKVEGSRGFINYNILKKSEANLTTTEIKMTKAEMKEFSNLCKREGVVFSGVVMGKNTDNAKIYDIVIKEEDLSRIKGVLDKLNENKKIQNIENREQEILNKEKLAPQDKVDLEILDKQKREIREQSATSINREQTQKAYADIGNNTYNNNDREKNLADALNKTTGRRVDINTEYIIADAKNPETYIKCHTYNDMHNGSEYIRTDYKVYDAGKESLSTTDARFQDRPQGYWEQQKAEIAKQVAFGATILKFHNMEKFQQWAQEIKDKSDIINETTKTQTKDYDTIIADLQKNLEENKSKLENENTNNKGTENNTQTRESITAENTVITRQIQNYETMKVLESDYAVAKTNLELADTNSEKNNASVEFNLANERLEGAKNKANELVEQRQVINSVKTEQTLANDDKQNLQENLERQSTNREGMSMQDVMDKIRNEKTQKTNGQKVSGELQKGNSTKTATKER